MQKNKQEMIIDALGLDDLDPEEREKILLDLHTIITSNSLVRIFEVMDEETKEAYDSLMSSEPTDEQLQIFIAESIPEADAIVENTVEELINDILEVTGT